jgi:hypothetical protein
MGVDMRLRGAGAWASKAAAEGMGQRGGAGAARPRRARGSGVDIFTPFQIIAFAICRYFIATPTEGCP